jgi:hypothetical protein
VSQILPTANLKNTKHINLVFRVPGWDRQLAGEFLDWLARRSTTPVTEDAKQAHLDELERRLSGKNLVHVSKESGVSLRDLGAMPIVLRHFSYVQISRPGAVLSFDVLNAGNELTLSREPAGLVLELFGVEGRIATSLVEVAIEAVRDWPVEHAFGGTAAFTTDFTLAHLRARRVGRKLHVRDFLWPFTFSHDLASVADETLKQLPVFRSGREAGGVWIWLFEDLSMGHSDKYFDAAKALGLRSLWEREILYGPGDGSDA